MQRFAEWKEPGQNRPWIAVVNRVIRRATWQNWASAFCVVGFFVFVGLTSKHSGSLFADDVPRWASKLHFGSYFAFSLFGIRELIRRKESERDYMPPADENPTVWLEIRNKWSMTKFDWARLEFQSGCLSFNGKHTQFLLNLEDIHSTSKVEHGTTALTIWIPTTGQRLKILNNSESNEAWEDLLNQLKQPEPSNRLSTFPPKTDHIKGLLSFFWLITYILTVESMILLTWNIAKTVKGYENFSLAVLFPTSLGLVAWILLIINLRLWSRKRHLKNQVAL